MIKQRETFDFWTQRGIVWKMSYANSVSYVLHMILICSAFRIEFRIGVKHDMPDRDIFWIKISSRLLVLKSNTRRHKFCSSSPIFTYLNNTEYSFICVSVCCNFKRTIIISSYNFIYSCGARCTKFIKIKNRNSQYFYIHFVFLHLCFILGSIKRTKNQLKSENAILQFKSEDNCI